MDFTTKQEEFAPYLLGAEQEQSPQNIALFKATLAGSVTGVREALKKGGKVYHYYHQTR